MTDLLKIGIYYYQQSFTEKEEDEVEEEDFTEEDFTEENITDKHKEWFFKYFNNFNDTENEEFNKELNNVIEKITRENVEEKIIKHFDDESIGSKKNTYSQKLIKLINYVKKNEKINLNEEEVQIIKLKRDKLDIELFIKFINRKSKGVCI